MISLLSREVNTTFLLYLDFALGLQLFKAAKKISSVSAPCEGQLSELPACKLRCSARYAGLAMASAPNQDAHPAPADGLQH